MARPGSCQNLHRERKPAVLLSWEVMLGIVQGGACVDLLVCESDRSPYRGWRSSPGSQQAGRMPSLLEWAFPCYHDNLP